MEVLILPRELHRKIIGHVEVSGDEEAVGLMAGLADGRITVVFPLPNLLGSSAFLADPRAQFEAERKIAQAGLHLLAIYHSHPGGGTEPSWSDLAYASSWPCAQVIVSSAGPAGNAMCAYRWQGQRLIEAKLVVEG